MAVHPAALQLRLLQTVVEVAAEKNSTLVLPFPVELLRFLERATPPETTTPTPARKDRAVSDNRQHNGGCGPTGADPTSVVAVRLPALAAVWCCSVGATWTVELHESDRDAVLGTIVDWISSGVPISEPEPAAALARELLTERGFQLFLDSSAGPSCPHRHSIGYACRDADLIDAGTRGVRPGRSPVATPARRVSDPRCVAPNRQVFRDGRVVAADGTAS
jgi:hypothetical protein